VLIPRFTADGKALLLYIYKNTITYYLKSISYYIYFILMVVINSDFISAS